MSDKKVKTFLPSDADAPDYIKELFSFPPIDFDKTKLDTRKLEAFERLVVELCHDFTVYKGMFGSEDARASTYKLGREVMFVVERAFLTQICLRYAALVHDKDKSNRPNEKVVSFSELINPLDSEWLNQRLDWFVAFYKDSGLKKWRNKAIAHNDLKVFLNRKQHLPELSVDVIENQLELLNECLNYLRDKQYQHTEVGVVLSRGEGLDKYQQQLEIID